MFETDGLSDYLSQLNVSLTFLNGHLGEKKLVSFFFLMCYLQPVPQKIILFFILRFLIIIKFILVMKAKISAQNKLNKAVTN